MKIRPVGAELLHADGRTDITKLIGAFSNFAIAPRNDTMYIRYHTSTSLELHIK